MPLPNAHFALEVAAAPGASVVPSPLALDVDTPGERLDLERCGATPKQGSEDAAAAPLADRVREFGIKGAFHGGEPDEVPVAPSGVLSHGRRSRG